MLSRADSDMVNLTELWSCSRLEEVIFVGYCMGLGKATAASR